VKNYHTPTLVAWTITVPICYNLLTMFNSDQTAKTPPLSGRKWWLLIIGLLVVGWLASTPEGLLGKADALGYAVCHRIDGRSFHIDTRQMPLCSRCTGMYLGAMLGLVVQMVAAPRRAGMPRIRHWTILGFFIAAFGVDGLNSYMKFFPTAPTFYETTNLTRLLTGSGMGLVVALMIYPAFNQSVWKNMDMKPVLSGSKMLAGLVTAVLLIDWLVYLQIPFLLYLFSLISAAGILVLLTMIYTVFWLFLLKRENQFDQISQMIFPIIIGFGTALLQIAIFDFARFTITGSWEGFIIG
jgi:uncharacterized membrane protein